MILAVLDTNQYISMAIKSGGVADRMLEAWKEGKYCLLVSPVIIAEIERVLRYPKVQRLISLSEEEIEDLLESLSQDAETISGTLEIHVVADDPSDNMFLSCAEPGVVNL